jgi:membrane protein implicated in regulation of membrane protease activity
MISFLGDILAFFWHFLMFLLGIVAFVFHTVMFAWNILMVLVLIAVIIIAFKLKNFLRNNSQESQIKNRHH